jgi:hypothetical protein
MSGACHSGLPVDAGGPRAGNDRAVGGAARPDVEAFAVARTVPSVPMVQRCAPVPLQAQIWILVPSAVPLALMSRHLFVAALTTWPGRPTESHRSWSF